ncbi:L-seryl-tRNA(Sec) selenium transferase [Halarsenatibacter silvermanii]|uniref:L-seryl-tRNA(Sec) selenium transferase n=1 Tax=Halarsenatibacter silvermanii TaxID=321763 RepID=UPI000B0A108D|nr:L-seryl-tRNA(Sec) selenium transferase [Halarsenatibacter silvermanii]
MIKITDKNEILRKLPAVDKILEWKGIIQLIDKYNRALVKKSIREVLEDFRETLLTKIQEESAQEAKNYLDELQLEDRIVALVENRLDGKSRPALAPAVNATGVIVHTNLGRSLLSQKARDMIERTGSHYSTLEIDRESGERGSRYSNVTELLCQLTGAESALVVNNNAAAVMLALATFAGDGEVVISRGELVEIGGSFRIPDVMKQSGAELVEVGTTNRVYIEDYENAINERTSLLLKVHTSNYKIMGFTSDVSIDKLSKLGDKHELPVLDDLGSGVMFDMRDLGLGYEPTLKERVDSGGDIITCSGDKILGGPQAGIILGRENLIEKMKQNPLTRAIRVDKLTLAGLEGTLKSYYSKEKALAEIPTLKMINLDSDELRDRAYKLSSRLKDIFTDFQKKIEIKISEGKSRVGGGAYPLTEIPSWTVVISFPGFDGAAEKAARKMRMSYPPVFCRISDNSLIFDVRTLLEGDIDKIARAASGLEVENIERI